METFFEHVRPFNMDEYVGVYIVWMYYLDMLYFKLNIFWEY